jgi:hypothetical protein
MCAVADLILAVPPQGDLRHNPNSVVTILVGEFRVEVLGVVEGQFGGSGHHRDYRTSLKPKPSRRQRQRQSAKPIQEI